MEVHEFAYRVLRSPDLETKLAPAGEELQDRDPGPPRRLEPARHPDITIRPATKVPDVSAMGDVRLRARILHALANHELQAAELFAWALLAFPEAPAEFRRGLVEILDDEQRHTRMYVARLEACGGRFGDHPVSGYFWSKVDHLTTPLRFVCAMSLTFENANLDHTADYADAARRAGDLKTAAVIERVQQDEVEHVRFGWRWLRRFKDPEISMWNAWREQLTWPLRPVKARGKSFNRSGREAAGLDPEFIRRLELSEP